MDSRWNIKPANVRDVLSDRLHLQLVARSHPHVRVRYEAQVLLAREFRCLSFADLATLLPAMRDEILACVPGAAERWRAYRLATRPGASADGGGTGRERGIP